MKKNANDLAEFRKMGNEIEDLRMHIEAAKGKIIAVLRQDQDSDGDFSERAEYFLELLLHAERVLEVLRHDLTECREALLSDVQYFAATKKERFRAIGNDILKTGELVGEILAAVPSKNT